MNKLPVLEAAAVGGRGWSEVTPVCESQSGKTPSAFCFDKQDCSTNDLPKSYHESSSVLYGGKEEGLSQNLLMGRRRINRSEISSGSFEKASNTDSRAFDFEENQEDRRVSMACGLPIQSKASQKSLQTQVTKEKDTACVNDIEYDATPERNDTRLTTILNSKETMENYIELLEGSKEFRRELTSWPLKNREFLARELINKNSLNFLKWMVDNDSELLSSINYSCFKKDECTVSVGVFHFLYRKAANNSDTRSAIEGWGYRSGKQDIVQYLLHDEHDGKYRISLFLKLDELIKKEQLELGALQSNNISNLGDLQKSNLSPAPKKESCMLERLAEKEREAEQLNKKSKRSNMIHLLKQIFTEELNQLKKYLDCYTKSIKFQGEISDAAALITDFINKELMPQLDGDSQDRRKLIQFLSGKLDELDGLILVLIDKNNRRVYPREFEYFREPINYLIKDLRGKALKTLAKLSKWREDIIAKSNTDIQSKSFVNGLRKEVTDYNDQLSKLVEIYSKYTSAYERFSKPIEAKKVAKQQLLEKITDLLAGSQQK